MYSCISFFSSSLSSRTSSKQGKLFEPALTNIPVHYRSRALLQYDNSNDIQYTYDAPFQKKYLRRNVIHDSLSARKQGKDTVKFGRRMKSKEDLIEQGLLTPDTKMFPTMESDCEETFNETDVNRY